MGAGKLSYTKATSSSALSSDGFISHWIIQLPQAYTQNWMEKRISLLSSSVPSHRFTRYSVFCTLLNRHAITPFLYFITKMW